MAAPVSVRGECGRAVKALDQVHSHDTRQVTVGRLSCLVLAYLTGFRGQRGRKRAMDITASSLEENLSYTVHVTNKKQK